MLCKRCMGKYAQYPGRPDVKEGIGAKPRFQEIGLNLLSHKSAEFVTDENIFDIQLESTVAVDTTVGLFHYDKESRETAMNSGTRAFPQRNNGILMYHLVLPEVGWYKLNIFADSQATRGPQLMCVFTYLFYVKTAKSTAYLLPKQFSDWTNECYLYSPLFLDSKCLSNVHFKVRVPKVGQVGVLVRGSWTMLQRQTEDRDVWEGHVCLEQYRRTKGVEVTVNAASSECSPGERGVFSTLLAYNL